MSILSHLAVAGGSVPNADTGRYNIFIDSADMILKAKDDSGQLILLSAADKNDKIKISGNDTAEGFLLAKLLASSGKITFTEVNDGGNEQLDIGVSADLFDFTSDDSDDIDEGSVNLFLTTTERGKIGFITVTKSINIDNVIEPFSVDLDAAEPTVTRNVVGGRTNFTVTHGRNTLDLVAEVLRKSDGRTIGLRVEKTGVNTIVFSRAGTVANGVYRVTIK